MEKKRIMVVDDEPDIREILQFNLENAGYDVVPAASAEAALDVCDGVDLILLDVMMEGMSGFKMAEILRKEKKSQIPIIFLTARSAENDLISRPSPIITGMFASPKRKKGRGFGTKSSSEEKNSEREARYTALSRNRIDITSLS